VTDHAQNFDAPGFSGAPSFGDAPSSSGGIIGRVASWGLIAGGMIITGAPLPNTVSPQQHLLYVEATSSSAGGTIWHEVAALSKPADTPEESDRLHEDTRITITELRRLSGLTWAQLAEIFEVSRRTVHFWASGKALNTQNETRLHQVYDIIKQAYRGDATSTRSAILAVVNGTSAFELLSASDFERARILLAQGVEVQAQPRTKLSAWAHAQRQPLNPEELVEALQERVHQDVGRGRGVKTVRHGAHKRG